LCLVVVVLADCDRQLSSSNSGGGTKRKKNEDR